MSKELTPLEALDRLRCFKTLNRDYEFKIIETALQEYEELQKDYCEVVEKWSKCPEKNNKKIKALDIIKDKPLTLHLISKCADYDEYLFVASRIIDAYQFGYTYDKEEFDLLKEVLK